MSIGFQENAIEEIKSRCNIVDVIGRYVPLKKMGNNHKGVCPFHNEKTPSFVVSENKQIFTCFGCGATGDVIEFVKRYHSLDFTEALQKLADEYGVEIKKKTQKSDAVNKELYEINREAATFFYKSFKNKDNPGYRYMKGRGLNDETLRKFGIGYADSQWSSLCDHFEKKGVSLKKLADLGLASFSKGKYYDKFRDRVIFPIINTRGFIVGFGGRALGDDNPKYLNSPETPIFYKKYNLYGLNLTRQDISRENAAILVEGYMDVISLYQNGIRNVSASLGTALTENQGAMLKRYTENIIIAYDMDTAGQAAALRGMDILHRAKCKVKVLKITDGKDPDDFIKTHGKEKFQELIKNALSFADYKIDRLKNLYEIGTTDGQVDFLKEVVKVLSDLSPIEADVYIKKISKETKISENAIRSEINGNNQIETPLRRPALRGNYRIEDHFKMTMLEKNLIKLMIIKAEFVEKIKPYEFIFRSSSGNALYSEIISCYEDNDEIDINKVADNLEEEDQKALAELMEFVQISDKEDQIFKECIEEIERRQYLKREKEILDILDLLDDEDNENQYSADELMKELKQIQEAIRPKNK